MSLVSVARVAALIIGLLASQTRAQGPDGLAGHGGPVRAVIALADGKTAVTAGFDSAIIVWDAAAGTAKRVLRFHDATVNALAATGSDCFLSGGEDARIALWCGDDAAPRQIFVGHQGPVAALAVVPDDRSFASAGWDHQVRIWRPGTAAAEKVVDGHTGPVNGIAFASGGRTVISAGYDGQLRLTPVDAAGPALVARLGGPLNGVAVAADGTILTAGADGRVAVFDPALRPVGDVQLGHGPLMTIALSPDGRTAAVAGLRTPVTLIDWRERRVTAEILGPGLPVWALSFTADGREIYSGGADRAVRRWNSATARPSGADLARPAADEKDDPAERGAVLFRACRACHGLTAEDRGRAGPSLHGLFGRRIASAPGYAYSDALRRLDIVWTPETVARLFEIGPARMTPGTKMPEQTISNPEDRKALVDWLAKVTR